jgi:hypothetical protein
MFIFFLIVGSAFALMMALYAAYTFGHMVGFERGEQDHIEREREAALMGRGSNG